MSFLFSYILHVFIKQSQLSTSVLHEERRGSEAEPRSTVKFPQGQKGVKAAKRGMTYCRHWNEMMLKGTIIFT